MRLKKEIVVVVVLIMVGTAVEAKDSTNVFKISVGVNYTQWKTGGRTTQNKFSHFTSSCNTLSFTDTIGFSPLLKIAYELPANKFVNFYLELQQSTSKLSYQTDSSASSGFPFQTNYSMYSELKTTEYKVNPTNFMFSLGPQFTINNFYLTTKLDFSFWIANSKVTTTTTTKITDSTYTETTTTHDFRKEYFWDAGAGAGILLGYNFKTLHYRWFIECEANYTLTSLYQLNAINGGLVLGVRF